MENIVESMAGRASILRLYPMTYLERYNINEKFWLDAYLKREADWHQEARPANLPFDIFTCMWLGGMPGLIDKDHDFTETFFSSYFETYIQKDVRLLAEIKNLSDFAKFTCLLAMNAAQEMNFSELGREIGIANSTALMWKNHLLNSFIWQEAMPYIGNTTKRLSKKPKGYMMDTGLLCYLLMIQSPKFLAQHPHVGSIFENYFFNQIMGYTNSLSHKPIVYHWRSSNQQEVDFVLQFDGYLYPIESKLKSNVSAKDARGIENFRKTYGSEKVHTGVVVYTGDKIRYLTDNVLAVPWNCVL
jgi:predicted AAA+ superfamily ATPase